VTGRYTFDAFRAQRVARIRLDRRVQQVLALQLLVTATIALPAWLFGGAHTAVSAALGGMIGFLSSLAYAVRMMMPRSYEPRDLLGAHVRAEAYRLVTIVVLLVAVLTLMKNVSTLPLLLTFIATLAVYWVALLLVK
jgi:ATP synthase protein I